jgi:hypothetical protein
VEARQPVAAAAPDAREQARERAAREATAKEAAAKEAAAKEAAAKEAAAKEVAAKEVAAKESAAKAAAERAKKEARKAAADAERVKEARKATAELERVKMSAAQPAKAPTRPSQAPNANPQGGWECVANPPSRQIACHPAGKKPASAKAPAAKQKLFETVVEPAAQEQPQETKRWAEPETRAQLWDCQPTPPDGQVVCRPIPASGNPRDGD